DAVFFAEAKTPVFGNGVIKLADLTGRTLVGYVYGGIESTAPYSFLSKVDPPTSASKRLFQVYVTPGASQVIPLPPLPTVETPVP
ncbi:MAG TPA: hypothetical protein VGO11_06705, partial [Chthoniobacteraceae bacterium]|nr:hypothetical protein [Chthoniobacteraceae bacterium]